MRQPCVISFIFCFFIASSLGFQCWANPPAENEIVSSISPLPEEPTIKGMRFVFWHQLRDLRTAIQSWLNPSNVEQYSFRGVNAIAPDARIPLQNHAALYESIRTDYLDLLNSGEIDSYGDVELGGSGDRSLPTITRFRLEVARAVYNNSLFTSSNYSQLLTIFHKELWDHRYITQFFFSTHVDRRHRPLESMVALSRSSSRAQAVIGRLIAIFGNRIAEANESSEQLIKKASDTASSADIFDLYRELDALKTRSFELQYRLEYIVSKLYKAVQFSNDLVRDKDVDAKGLDAKVALLGKGLKNSLEAIALFKNARVNRAHILNFTTVGTLLSDPMDDLKEIFGVDAHYAGRTVPDHLLRDGDQKVFEMYRDTLIMQYILATGSIMAKISQLPEGRGGILNQLGQEFRYRNAQLQVILRKNSAVVGTEETGQSLISRNDTPSSIIATINRRDFANSNHENERNKIEDRLWKIFFDKAGLFDVNNDVHGECARLLIQATQTVPLKLTTTGSSR